MMKIRLIPLKEHLCSFKILTRSFRQNSITTKNMKPSPAKRPFRVSIEGNIGAGKSALITHFSKIQGIETYEEPIAWWRNVNGNNLLDLMYSNIREWLKVFQNYVQLTRLKVQTSKPKSPNTFVQMFERSLQNNRYCFVELARKGGYLSDPDFAVLDQWYQWINNNINVHLDLIVYLRSSPEVVFERIKIRGRPEERAITLDYLKELHEAHEEWLIRGGANKIPVLVMDADRTLEEVHEQFKTNEKLILGCTLEED